jgi:phage terminase large subunit
MYQSLKEKNIFNFDVFEWATADNPYFPKEELESLKNSLDPRTYRAMFELDWNIPATNRVYDDFDDNNITENIYNPNLPVFVAVDWGWNDPTVFLFIQYDARTDCVYIIDEVVRTKTKLSDIMEVVRKKPYRIADWYCDAAGLQTNEQTARSNVQIMREDYNITFKWKRTPIIQGVVMMRSYIKTAKGQRKFIVDKKCEHTIDEFMGYRFKEKNGMVTDEFMDVDNHTLDAARYWFVNFMGDRKTGDTITGIDKWQFMGW